MYSTFHLMFKIVQLLLVHGSLKLPELTFFQVVIKSHSLAIPRIRFGHLEQCRLHQYSIQTDTLVILTIKMKIYLLIFCLKGDLLFIWLVCPCVLY